MGEIIALLQMFNKQFHQEVVMITTCVRTLNSSFGSPCNPVEKLDVSALNLTSISVP